ncbi:sorcin-like isoform X1 [Durio zibethinus]|uniref:Sorcin-like isoform X1 n=1 Tax=Durio zibethinus TaxID=66656 RepID=A0A6P5WH22_DURZI|nr:sorcin-like isoform X1 [Durio zibethinus]
MEDKSILREWFERVDSEKTGSITATQLKSAFAIGNLDFPLSVVQQMIRMYDFDRNGTMSFEEFLALNTFLIKVSGLLSTFTIEIQTGPASLRRLGEALNKMGFSLDSPAFYTACESFDKKKNGRFQLDDFISLCIFLQSARNLFNAFDTAKQGRVTLDLNQFVYCTASCRI